VFALARPRPSKTGNSIYTSTPFQNQKTNTRSTRSSSSELHCKRPPLYALSSGGAVLLWVSGGNAIPRYCPEQEPTNPLLCCLHRSDAAGSRET